MEPLVSVIIAAYNIESYIDKCIESVVNQTYNNLEILVVNDGSKDDTYKHAMVYQENDKRVKVLDKVNGGLSDARNYGLDNSRGEYVLFVDGDDYLANDMIEKLYYGLINADADMCICNIQNVTEDGRLLDSPDEEQIRPGLHSREEMLNNIADTPNWFWIVAWNKLYKRGIFKDLRFAKGKIHEDEFLVHRAFDECTKIAIIPDKLYFYVQRENSITHVQYKVSNLDSVEAFLDRAEFYFENKYIENGIKMLWTARTYYLDGYIALMNNNSQDKKQRLEELHNSYKQIYKKNEKIIRSVKNTFLLWLFKTNVILAVYTSGNYRNTRR